MACSGLEGELARGRRQSRPRGGTGLEGEMAAETPIMTLTMDERLTLAAAAAPVVVAVVVAEVVVMMLMMI